MLLGVERGDYWGHNNRFLHVRVTYTIFFFKRHVYRVYGFAMF